MPITQSAFRQLVEALPHLVWTCLPSGECDYLSPQWVAYSGEPASAQLGSHWVDLVHPDDRPHASAAWAEATRQRVPLETDCRIRRHDGAYRWFKTRAVAELNPDGRIARWFGTNTDVQDLRDSQLALAQLNNELEDRVQERTVAATAARARLLTLAEQLEVAQSVAHLGSWHFDLSTDQVIWSTELFRILRQPEADAAPPFSLHHTFFAAESWDLLRTATTYAIATGVGYELELQLAPTLGASRWAIARGKVQHDADGRVIALFGTFQDITELKRARLERDRSAERVALATSSAGIGIWDLTIATGTLTWDDQLYDLYRIPRGTPMTYADWCAAVHDDDRADADALVQAAVASGSDYETTFRVQPTTHGDRYLRSCAKVLRDRSGAPVRMIGVNFDVTAEIHAVRLQEELATLLKQFIRNAPAAIAMLDRNFSFVEASDRWMVDYGVTRERVIGHNYYDVFPSTPDRWKAMHRRVLAGEVHSHDADPFVQQDGSTIWLRWEARPWYDRNRALNGILIFTQNVTAAIASQQALRAQADELARSNQHLQEFAFAASHDLQEPLRAMAGCAQILAANYKGRLDPDADALTQHMVDGAERMRTLIDDLLAFARVGMSSLALAPVDLGEVVAESQLNLAAAIGGSDAVIELGPMPVVRGDRRQLAQLFQNLLGNSIKYAGDAAPRITITAEARNDCWLCSVRDNGIGVPADARERIFQIFQRLHSRDEYPGTGVGLALCRRIIERHGGRIWADAATDRGTDIRFTLPRHA